MIEPTEGRIVHFFPHDDEGLPPGTKHAAIVAGILDLRTVNLAVFNSNGALYSVQAVQLLQDDDAAPAKGHYAAWMPFQKGQAAKTEAAQAGTAAPALDLSPVHEKLAELEQGVDGKFQALGDWLQASFKDLETRIAAVTPPAAEAPAAAAALATAADAAPAPASDAAPAPASDAAQAAAGTPLAQGAAAPAAGA